MLLMHSDHFVMIPLRLVQFKLDVHAVDLNKMTAAGRERVSLTFWIRKVTRVLGVNVAPFYDADIKLTGAVFSPCNW